MGIRFSNVGTQGILRKDQPLLCKKRGTTGFGWGVLGYPVSAQAMGRYGLERGHNWKPTVDCQAFLPE